MEASASGLETRRTSRPLSSGRVDGDAGVYRGFRRIDAALPGNRLSRQSRNRSLEPRPQFIVNPTAQPGPRVSRMVVAPIERPNILQRDRLQALHRADRRMRIRRAGEDKFIQRRLAQLLVGGKPQRVFEVVDGVAADALKVARCRRPGEGRRRSRVRRRDRCCPGGCVRSVW